MPGRAPRTPALAAPGFATFTPRSPGPSDATCARERSTGSAMFFTCAPGGFDTVGPTSNMAIVASGARSERIRA